MVTVNLPKFGKIKIDGTWCDFNESNVIIGIISDDYCKFKIEEFKPKMNKYKIIPNQNKHPDSITYEFMNSYFTVESDSPINAFRKYYERNGFALSLDLFGYVLDTESLDLYYASWSVDEQIGYSSFARKLEKPKMKTYRLIPNQKNLNPSYEEMMASEYLIEAHSPKNALERHRNLNPKVDCGMTLDIGTLDLYRVLYTTSFLYGESYTDCFVRKLEKPEPKMNKYKLSLKCKHVQDSLVVIEARNPSEAVIKYCKECQYTNIHMYAMNIETLVVFEIFWKKDINGKVTTWTVQTDYIPEIKTKPMNKLSFKTLTEANNKRLPLFKNSKGLPAHSKPDGSDWSHAEWLQAAIGELGEYANIMKKVQRGDLTMEEAKSSIEKELADVMTYFSILAQQLNIDLGQAVENKFNEVSDRVKADVYIKDDKVVTRYEMSGKEELRTELDKLKVKVKKKNLTAQLYHKPVSFSSDQVKTNLIKWDVNPNYATTAMIVGLAQMLSPLFIKKPVQKTITLQDLNNGKVYTRPFVSGFESTTLQEFSKLIVTDATVMKTLLNGKDYDGFNVNVGDMIQFSDDRNVLYSLRVTKIE